MNSRFQLWIEHHIDDVVSKYEKDKQKTEESLERTRIRNDKAKISSLNAKLLEIEEAYKETVKDENDRLDRFLELLRNDRKKPKKAEKEAFKVDTRFYLRIKQEEEKEQRRIEAERRKAEREEKAKERARQKEIDEFNRRTNLEEKARKRRARRRRLLRKKKKAEALEKATEKPKPLEELDGKFYMEKKLPAQQRELLFAKGYKRLKISPYGNSGATFYWVSTRYNESKEHAFFCYLIEAELKKYIKKVDMNVNNGPDIVFEHKGKRYCFDVETGKNRLKHPEALESKFRRYKKQHEVSYILITNKSLKYKYSKYGVVVTRGKLREILSQLFLNAP